MSVVLVGMSVSDVDRRDRLLEAAQGRDGSVAFLQLADPSLSAELTRLADGGATTITLVGIDTGPLAPGHSWLRRIAAHWWRERSGRRPTIEVATALATTIDDIDALLRTTQPITGGEPGLTPRRGSRSPGTVTRCWSAAGRGVRRRARSTTCARWSSR